MMDGIVMMDGACASHVHIHVLNFYSNSVAS